LRVESPELISFSFFHSGSLLGVLGVLCGSKKPPKKLHGVRAWTSMPEASAPGVELALEKNHGKDGKYGKKKTDKWQMTYDKSPMTNDKSFRGPPRFNRLLSSPGVTGRLVRQCEWDSASPLKFARAVKLPIAPARPAFLIEILAGKFTFAAVDVRLIGLDLELSSRHLRIGLHERSCCF
jgi:hypothetical protein